MLELPQLARRRMQERTLHIAMAIGPDLGKCAIRGADKRIVLRDGAVRVDADDLANAALQVLRLHACRQRAAITLGDEQRAILCKDKPRTEMLVRREGRPLAIDDRDVLDGRRRPIHQLALSHSGVVPPIRARLGIAPVDHLVGREVRIERHVEQPALTDAMNHRHAALDRRRDLARRIRDAELAGNPLGDQEPATRQEFHRPRRGQTRSDDLLHLIPGVGRQCGRTCLSGEGGRVRSLVRIARFSRRLGNGDKARPDCKRRT